LYKELKRLKDENRLAELVKCGVISVSVSNHFEIYESYLKELRSIYLDKKSDALKNVAIKYNVSDKLIYYIIDKMK